MTVTKARYARPQVWLHWLTVLLLLVSLISHDAMEDAWDLVEDGGAAVGALPHRLAGVAILFLTLARLVLRMRYGAPPEPPMPPLMALAATFSHIALYALLIILPILGLTAWVGGVEAAAELHGTLVWLLWIIVVLHVAAALFHQFVRRDGLMGRMMRF
ncbi:cytochrome b [Pseudoroseicyclus sp. CXY001]|uniref:cytochrome b n=1 Tax=Pseudoroseicyclus sp. CXY001 TaxID=3242492 RepID=UPI003570D4CC